MITIADIEHIMQIEHILEDFFYEDTLKGSPALLHEKENILLGLYLKDEMLVFYVFDYATDKEWNILLCEADENVADFIQDLPSAVSYVSKNSTDSSAVVDLLDFQEKLDDDGLLPDEDYIPDLL